MVEDPDDMKTDLLHTFKDLMPEHMKEDYMYKENKIHKQYY